MRLDIGVIGAVICLSALLDLSSPGVSAFFFPNASAIPPSLRPNFTGSPWEAFNNYTGCRPGDKRDGLGKLKKYFNDFGYIPDGSGNFTDDFDDALEAAVKAYQKNFNLEQTGQLDDATLKQIVKPRCGNPDIINGTTTMSSGLTNSPSSIFHTVGHYTFFPGMPQWPADRRDLTYAFLPGNDLSNDTKAAFERAFQRWAEVTPLTFTATSLYSTADITVGFYTGDHGDGEAFDGVLGTLAHAFSPPNGRFHLDGEEDWIIQGDVTTASVSTAVDLESVAVHEIGHLLGLGHSSVEESIMYPTISARTRKVQLANDDIQGIQVLYGSNPNYNGSSTVDSTQERESSNSGPRFLSWTTAAALSAVGLSVLLF